MPVPDLCDGLLPGGVHECSLDEFEQVFSRWGQRGRLVESLHAYLGEVRTWVGIDSLLIDGSFVTDKAEPNDIDLVVVLAGGVDLGSADVPQFYRTWTKPGFVRRKFQERLDLKVASRGSSLERRWIDFFSEVKDAPGRTKGILRVGLQ